jgi:hypothetical protein
LHEYHISPVYSSKLYFLTLFMWMTFWSSTIHWYEFVNDLVFAPSYFAWSKLYTYYKTAHTLMTLDPTLLARRLAARIQSSGPLTGLCVLSSSLELTFCLQVGIFYSPRAAS